MRLLLMITNVYIIVMFIDLVTGLHQFMTKKERLHVFGTDDQLKLPKYWIEHPRKQTSRFDGQPHLVSLTIDDVKYDFQLKNHDLLAPGFHSVNHHTMHNRSIDHNMADHCVWQGTSTSHNHTRIALVGCDQQMHGIVSTETDHYLINPVPKQHLDRIRNKRSTSIGHPHIIQKRGTEFHDVGGHYREENMDKPCLFDPNDDPSPPSVADRDEMRRLADSPIRLAVTNQQLTIELAAFADDAMWDHFQDIYGVDAEEEMQKFILTATNNIDHLFDHRSIDPKLRLKIVRYEAMKTPPVNLRSARHNNGEVDLLLENFCDYQNNINPSSDSDSRHWDHALLFSGYDLYRGNLKSVAGYAPVKGMCSSIRSCTINEGLDFGAVFVITHEMGHSLGMYHDGDNGCDSRCCVMSPSVGSGKTAWSDCSVRELDQFISKLGTSLQPDNCLLDGISGRAAVNHNRAGKLPGQVYNLHQQCRIFHGDCWAHELRDGQSLRDVCEMVWCGGGEGIIRTSHPALEGSFCDKGKWCIDGVCKSNRVNPPPVVHGRWGDWSDSPSGTCGGGCSSCSIAGQMRVKRSLRLCEDPAPNNGGDDCDGSSVRGLICSQIKCSGPSPDEYASKECTKLSQDPDTPDLQLSGKGFQYEQSPCKIWCHMRTNGFIRTVGNFPDGTPCGASSYCVKGSCQKLACENKAIVADPVSDCPDAKQRAAGVPAQQSTEWGGWSDWTSCSSTCGRGVRQRVRACLGRVCLGTSRQREACQTRTCTDDSWGSWASWSPCDVTCGQGRRSRRRSCNGNDCAGSTIQLQACASSSECDSGSDDQSWSNWASWSSCTRSCDGGVRLRRRQCKSRICSGRSSQSQTCNEQRCRRIVEKAEWQTWTSWTSCTRTCGGGTRFRKRRCNGDGICYGSSIEFGSCKSKSCNGRKPLNIFLRRDTPTEKSRDVPDAPRSGQKTEEEERDEGTFNWGQWADWGDCSASCGGGYRRRTRTCATRQTPCRGLSSATRSCNNLSCEVFAGNSFESTPTAAVVGNGARWGAWSDWTNCSVSCDRGVTMRRRQCLTGDNCQGSFRQLRYCQMPAC